MDALHRQAESSLFACVCVCCVLYEYVIHYVQNVRLYGKSHISLLVRLFSFWLSAVREYEWVRCDADLFFQSHVFERSVVVVCFCCRCCSNESFFVFGSNQRRSAQLDFEAAIERVGRKTNEKNIMDLLQTNRFVGFSKVIRARPSRLDNS